MNHPTISGELLGRLTQPLYFFFYCLDERRYDDLVALFATDGIWHRQGKQLRGQAEIRQAMEARSATQRIRHVLTNAFISELDGDRVTVRSYMTAYRHDDGKPAPSVPRIPGPLSMSLVTTVFGRNGNAWLIAEQTLTPEFEFGAVGSA